jgi:hypothetical protein
LFFGIKASCGGLGAQAQLCDFEGMFLVHCSLGAIQAVTNEITVKGQADLPRTRDPVFAFSIDQN